MSFPHIEATQKYSDGILQRLRDELSVHLSGDDYCVVACGSFARREASKESDLDFFVISDDQNPSRFGKVVSTVLSAVKRVGAKEPSVGGAFAEIDSIKEMAAKIGGQDDSNKKMTRRLLFLLEGDWIYNREGFNRYREEVMGCYIKPTISDHQMIRFFLNDLIRYYRQMCVDFQFKTGEQAKPWGTRNIKLLFSRKLIYFGGVLVVAESIQRDADAKKEKAIELLALTPLNRITQVCGPSTEKAFAMYDFFLGQISSSSIRKKLDLAKPDDRKTQSGIFRVLKNEGHHFSWELARLLHTTYDISHPIHHALIF